MASALIIFLVVSLALILALSVSGGRAEQLNIQDWEARKQAIDVEILRALLDRDDWRYLRKSLSPREFQVFQRKRIRLGLRILRLVERNADLLMELGRLGRLGRLNGDPVRRQQADELVAGIIQLRLNLLRRGQWLFPQRHHFLISCFRYGATSTSGIPSPGSTHTTLRNLVSHSSPFVSFRSVCSVFVTDSSRPTDNSLLCLTICV